jgi:hypothetical protein
VSPLPHRLLCCGQPTSGGEAARGPGGLPAGAVLSIHQMVKPL